MQTVLAPELNDLYIPGNRLRPKNVGLDNRRISYIEETEPKVNDSK